MWGGVGGGGTTAQKCMHAVGHRRRIKTKEKAKVVTVGRGTYLNAALTI